MNEPNWTGDERRSIPIHVLNYIKDVVTEETTVIKQSFDKYQQDFKAHDVQEMARYDLILKNQQSNAEASQERDHKIIDSLTAVLGRIELMDSAFLKDNQGNADYHGHNYDHSARVKESEARKEFWGKLKFSLAQWGLVGFVGWLLVQVWTGALKGPQ